MAVEHAGTGVRCVAGRKKCRMGINVLSTFDGMACGLVALKRAGIQVDNYFASEIDPYAMQIAKKNHPEIVHLGDITKIKIEVMRLSEVYGIILAYDNNLQNQLPEWEMLYWIDKKFTISKNIRTSLQDGKQDKSSRLQCYEEVRFSKSGMGCIIKTQDPTGSGAIGEGLDKDIQSNFIQCGDWWYVYRSDFGNKKENIYGTIGKKAKTGKHRENKKISKRTIQNSGKQADTFQDNKISYVETVYPKEVFEGAEEPKKWSREEERNREREARIILLEIKEFIQERNETDRAFQNQWNFLSVHTEMETTVVRGEESVHIFLGKFQLLLGGSPCQGFSNAGKGRNFDDPRSKLFYTYVDILFHLIDRNPKVQFLLENVKMKKEWQNIITDVLGVDPVEINSALVSAQVRKRLYWANWKIEQPEDKNLVIYDILEDKGIPVIKSHGEYKLRPEKAMYLDANYWKGVDNHGQRTIIISSDCIELGHAVLNGHDFLKRVYSIWGKCPTLTAVCGGNQNRKIAMNEFQWRKLTPVECERLQTLDDRYSEGVSNTQRYKMIGNGWNVDTIVHILNSNPKLIHDSRS